jgi:hypothetical protein
METIFTLGDEDDSSVKINLDDLYERKQQLALNTLKIYNRILQRIHGRIRHLSHTSRVDQHCWYVVPEIIIGVPKYDHNACIVYIIDKLKDNGFVVRYTHPNLLFVSWKSWTPGYVREEIRKQTGIQIDGWGNKKNQPSEQNIVNNGFKNPTQHKQLDKDYRSINTYKPTGNLIYNQELLRTIQDKSA